MAKGRRRGPRSRRRGDDSSSCSSHQDSVDAHQPPRDQIDVQRVMPAQQQQQGFKERRELERKDAALKRRAKQRCHLCGKTGHVRRACPGFEDDGRGESKFTKSKGDNTTSGGGLKTSHRTRDSKAAPSSSTSTSISTMNMMIDGLDVPEGFEPIDETTANKDDELDSPSRFYYYDAMCDGSATLQFLQNGRAGALLQKTKDEALQEYHRIISKSTATSNFGGCIAQVYLKTNQSWSATSTLPLPWSEVTYPSALFVIGLNPGYDCLEEHRELAKSVLRAACADRHCVVGLCAMLDYSIDDCRAAQLARALVTCEAAVEAEIPLQLKLFSAAVVARTECQENDTSPYLQLLQDVCMILETHPTVLMHLCSWTGLADDMMALIHRFPGRVWIGLDGSVTFAKAVSLHECAFDIPIECLLLETGTNIPTPVATALGRQAFSHSGLIPYVAAGVAKYKGSSFSARQIARAASDNAIGLYHLMNHTDTIKHWPRLGAATFAF